MFTSWLFFLQTALWRSCTTAQPAWTSSNLIDFFWRPTNPNCRGHNPGIFALSYTQLELVRPMTVRFLTYAWAIAVPFEYAVNLTYPTNFSASWVNMVFRMTQIHLDTL